MTCSGIRTGRIAEEIEPPYVAAGWCNCRGETSKSWEFHSSDMGVGHLARGWLDAAGHGAAQMGCHHR